VPMIEAPPGVLPPTFQLLLPVAPVVNNTPSTLSVVPATILVELVMFNTELKVKMLPPAPPASLVTLYSTADILLTLVLILIDCPEPPGSQIGNLVVDETGTLVPLIRMAPDCEKPAWAIRENRMAVSTRRKWLQGVCMRGGFYC